MYGKDEDILVGDETHYEGHLSGIDCVRGGEENGEDGADGTEGKQADEKHFAKALVCLKQQRPGAHVKLPKAFVFGQVFCPVNRLQNGSVLPEFDKKNVDDATAHWKVNSCHVGDDDEKSPVKDSH